MISAKKLAANRANAQKSTGPRTRAGKLRSSGNARRHGLTALPDAAGARAIADLARRIGALRPHLHDLAVHIATTQHALDRARRARLELLAQIEADIEAGDVRPQQLWRLEAVANYERRACSRRKLAIMRYDEAVALCFEPVVEACRNKPTAVPTPRCADVESQNCKNEPNAPAEQIVKTKPPRRGAPADRRFCKNEPTELIVRCAAWQSLPGRTCDAAATAGSSKARSARAPPILAR